MFCGDVLSCVYQFVRIRDRRSFQLVSKTWYEVVPYVNVLSSTGIQKYQEDVLGRNRIINVPSNQVLTKDSVLFSESYVLDVDVDALVLYGEEDIGYGLFGDSDEDEITSVQINMIPAFLQRSVNWKWSRRVFETIRCLGMMSDCQDALVMVPVFPLMTSLQCMVLHDLGLNVAAVDVFPSTLEEITLHQVRFADDNGLLPEILAKRCPRLRFLQISMTALARMTLQHFNPQYFRAAQMINAELELDSFFTNLGQSPVCPWLEELQVRQYWGTVNHDAFVSFASNAKRLRELELGITDQRSGTATPTTFLALGGGCPRLQSVKFNMRGCPEMVAELLRPVLPPTCEIDVTVTCPPEEKPCCEDTDDDAIGLFD
eukprot:PhF_6_TR5142/c0_g1_i1/m.7335